MADKGAKPTIYISFHDQIDTARVNGIMGACAQLIAQHDPSCLYFGFSSPGGSVTSGITLYNFLRGLPVEIVMHNIGSIDSISTVVFLAGNRRYASPHSTFLFHGVQLNIAQAAHFACSQLQEALSGLEQDETRIAEIIAGRSKIDETEIRELFQRGDVKTPSFALDKGFVDEIKEFEIPTGSLVAALHFKQQAS